MQQQTNQPSEPSVSTDGDQEQRRRFERKPNFDMQASLSKDGKYWIIKKIETWILPKRYLDVISQNFVGALSPPAVTPAIETKVDEAQKRTSKRGKRHVDGNG